MKNARRPVPADAHGNRLRDTGADKVSHTGSPQIVEQFAFVVQSALRFRSRTARRTLALFPCSGIQRGHQATEPQLNTVIPPGEAKRHHLLRPTHLVEAVAHEREVSRARRIGKYTEFRSSYEMSCYLWVQLIPTIA
jgi:hypothetical protein